MGLSGKKVVQVDIKCNRDIIHGLFRYRLPDLLILAPEFIKSCELQEGELGVVGSIINSNYALDEKIQFVKFGIEAVDEENKQITNKVYEGDLLKVYKGFKVHVHVNGTDENSMVTWTFEYEKMNEDVPDPDSLVEAAQSVTKFVEIHMNPDVLANIKIPQLQ